jgi:hypothetical protein
MSSISRRFHFRFADPLTGRAAGSSAKCISESLEILEMIPIPLIFRNSLKCGKVQHRHCDFGKILRFGRCPVLALRFSESKRKQR